MGLALAGLLGLVELAAQLVELALEVSDLLLQASDGISRCEQPGQPGVASGSWLIRGVV
jgi:hypothetical protein